MKKITPKKTPGKKPQVVVPEAGETQYVVINPAQIEKLEEAVNRLTAAVEGIKIDPTKISFNYSDTFVLTLGSFLMYAIDKDMTESDAIARAKDLIKAAKEQKK